MIALPTESATTGGADAPESDGGGISALLAETDAQAAAQEHAAAGTCKDAADWLDEPDEPDEPLVCELIGRGEMVAVVGQSKAGKSFLALQLAVCVALGVPFLGRETVRQRVYVANLEVSRKQYKKRLREIVAALGATAESLRGWLFVDNMKGENATWKWCRDEANTRGGGVAVIDPFYRIFKDEESDVKACLAAVAEMEAYQRDGLTLIVVFHSPKGFAGDRQLIDQISGSSVLARFPESIVGLLNHAAQKQCHVVKCVLRNYAPPDDQTIRFDNGVFRVADDVPPIVQSGNQRGGNRQAQAEVDLSPTVREVLEKNGWQKRKGTLVGMVRELHRKKCGITPGEKKTRDAIQAMVDHGELVEAERQAEQGGSKPIGLPGQMEWYVRPTLNLQGGK